MRIAVFGAGAIGGYIAAELALSGADVTIIARGLHLAAIQNDGLRLEQDGAVRTSRPRAFADAGEAGPQDVVFLTLKAHQVAAAVADIRKLLGPDTAVVNAMNGVPWWYFHRLAGPYEGHRVESVDPGGVQWDGIGPERAIGCVVFPACDVPEPGLIRHIAHNRLTLGEPSGEKTERLAAIARALVAANIKAPVRTNIRDEIWVKLWGNLAFNPISALTLATMDRITGDDGTRAVTRQMMVESQNIAEKLGVRFPIDVDQRIAGAAGVGAHKTSMLQDLEKGRALEIDALVSAVQEMGRLTATACPTIDTVLALVRLRARQAGLYG
ncbi:MAG: 2-dehydropantoate 2-reductase [Alphaproteobacteria bacterium]